MIGLGDLGGNYSFAQDVNDRGSVVGYSETSWGADHAFLWRRGRMIDLGTLGGRSSYATAINNRGEVVGYSDTGSGLLHGFLWRRGRMVDLGTLTGGPYDSSLACDINNRGVVAKAFR